jgi:hypothetical protein
MVNTVSVADYIVEKGIVRGGARVWKWPRVPPT